MNYYPFHIGDYAVHTRHLSLLEDLAYRRLLDLYYTRERAIPAETQSVCRLLGMREQVAEVEAVLNEFFARTDAGEWIHLRCDEEIAKAHAAADRARTNGKAGGRPVGSKKEPGNNPAETQPVISANPEETKSQAPNPKTNTKKKEHVGADAPVFKPEGFKAFWDAWPKGGRKGGETKCLEVWKRKRYEQEASSILAHIETLKASVDWRKDAGQFIPAPLSYLNGQKWDGAEIEGETQPNFAGAL